MGNFFSSLFKLNLGNVGKAIIGGATGVLSYPAVLAAAPIVTPVGALIVAVLIGAGTALGIHGYDYTDSVNPAKTTVPKTPN